MSARTGHQVFVALMMLALLGVRPLEAQRPTAVASEVRATRSALEAALQVFESAARSQGYSPALRERARQEAAAVRTRLQRGDFRPGDPIRLAVEGQTALSDTFVVNSAGAVVLPTLGTVSLQGVLRSELETYLAQRIGEFVRNPVVTANSLFRISATGAVAQPGMHFVGPDMPLPEALTALGLTAQADVTEIEIFRGGRPLLRGDAYQVALRDGSTLTELGIRSGDHIVVPDTRQVQLSPWEVWRTAGFIATFLFGFNRVF